MPTQVRQRKQNGTTKSNSIAMARQTQPPPASQTQRTSKSSAVASSGVVSSTGGSQSDGAPQISQEIPAIAIANGREVRVRVRLASENAVSLPQQRRAQSLQRSPRLEGMGIPLELGIAPAVTWPGPKALISPPLLQLKRRSLHTKGAGTGSIRFQQAALWMRGGTPVPTKSGAIRKWASGGG